MPTYNSLDLHSLTHLLFTCSLTDSLTHHSLTCSLTDSLTHSLKSGELKCGVRHSTTGHDCELHTAFTNVGVGCVGELWPCVVLEQGSMFDDIHVRLHWVSTFYRGD